MNTEEDIDNYTNDQGLLDVLAVEPEAKRALIIGDPMYDVYWKAKLTGVSAEVPIPKVACDKGDVVYQPGGAANVLSNLRMLGVNAVMVYPEDAPRPEKNRLMVGTYQMARWDYMDYCSSIDPRTITKAFKLHKPDVIVVADYNKGTIDGPVLKVIEEISKDLPLYIDTKRDPSEFPEKACFFPNQTEYDTFPSEYSLLNRCVLKQGEHGMRLIEQGEVIGSVEALIPNPICVNGAGDTVMAAFIVAELEGHASPLYFASVAAAVAVVSAYTTIVSKGAIKEMADQLKAQKLA